jgi:predicted metal-binding membrane protein
MFKRKEFNWLRNGVMLVSLLAWILILVPRGSPCHCLAGATGSTWQKLLAANPPAALASGWALMLVAMMAPMLVPPIYFIHYTSFAHTRAQLIALFVAGYGAVWMAVGAIFTAAVFIMKQWLPQSWWPVAIIALAALVWQASPGKQICLNRCHRHRPLAAFGFAARRDALSMGFEHGTWCVASCWALMLFPMLLPSGHNLAMVAVTIVMFCERLDPGGVLAWRLRGFRTAFLYLRQKLHRSRTNPVPFAQPLGS